MITFLNFSELKAGWKLGVKDAKNGVGLQFKKYRTPFYYGYHGGYHWQLNKEKK